MIIFGPLNRSCKLYSRSATSGAGGVAVFTDTFLRNFSATKQPATRRTPNDEQLSIGGRTAGVGIVVYRTRYAPEMRTGLKVTSEGRSYLVVRCDELGHREGWDIYLEDVR